MTSGLYVLILSTPIYAKYMYLKLKPITQQVHKLKKMIIAKTLFLCVFLSFSLTEVLNSQKKTLESFENLQTVTDQSVQMLN